MNNSYYAPFQRPIGYYNPAIPADYQYQTQMAQMPQQTAQQMPQTQQQMPFTMQGTADFVWVLGETEAISYPVAPNNSVTLWDKNRDTIYIKSVNAQGVPTLRILDYNERADGAKTANVAQNTDGAVFVSVDDFKALQGKFDGLRVELDELKTKQKAKTMKVVKMEGVDDEQ